MKVWNGLTKFILSQTNQERVAKFSLLGSFYLNKNDNDNKDWLRSYWFIPDSEFLKDGKFHIQLNDNN